jgi:hypothetical protein
MPYRVDLTRKHGISEVTFYRWKSKYSGMEVSDAKRLKALEAENPRLKRISADTWFHDYRRAYITNSRRMGIDERTIMNSTPP